ncbi:protein MEMO1 [Trichonephila inaurata madagascariensis]|uniref:Protein MEMO1 n=1 Tax=Trichonephila inaurata madagascariensis TaxID=2747483 RepID=A0A8X6M4X6_9ARAC|nr:protein MEMO1 [Trichonephila inaurata madagascariensis]
MSSQSSIRRATHAGSWYVSSAKDLSSQLENWLNVAGEPNHCPARAIIAPHAGYQYCGACSAYAYKQVDPTIIKHVFILGPSHHVRLSGCALSPVRIYRTPFGDLTISETIYEELYSTGHFEEMTLGTDEDEHSIEMHLPFIAKVMENHSFTIVPVLVGSLTTEKESMYGKIFSRYLADPSNLFVISSDFCHWGARFHYQYYEQSWGQIYQSIEKLDEMGMNIIEELSPTGFTSYLKRYGNTICGRHPIGVLLNAVSSLQQQGNGIKPSLKFLKYAQSSKCLNNYDSSVSYAAASLVIA